MPHFLHECNGKKLLVSVGREKKTYLEYLFPPVIFETILLQRKYWCIQFKIYFKEVFLTYF